MRKIDYAALTCLLVLSIGCSAGVDSKNVWTKYPPRSKLPIKLDLNIADAEVYDKGYIPFGSIKITGRDNARALKTAAERGADAVKIEHASVHTGYHYTRKHRKVMQGDGSYATETKVYRGDSTYSEGLRVNLYRHDPEQANRRYFWHCTGLDNDCSYDTVRKLLSQGVDPNDHGAGVATPIYNTVIKFRWKKSGEKYATRACTPTYQKIKLFIEKGADPNATPRGYPPIIQYLRKPRDKRMPEQDNSCLKKIEGLLLSGGATP